jgi:hypothetical protein
MGEQCVQVPLTMWVSRVEHHRGRRRVGQPLCKKNRTRYYCVKVTIWIHTQRTIIRAALKAIGDLVPSPRAATLALSVWNCRRAFGCVLGTRRHRMARSQPAGPGRARSGADPPLSPRQQQGSRQVTVGQTLPRGHPYSRRQAERLRFTARLGSDRGPPTCQQIVSSDPTRCLASHHGALSRNLPE